MVLRETAFAAERGKNRNLQQFGEFPQFVPGRGMQYALSGTDNWTFRRNQCFGNYPDISRVAGAPDRFNRGVLKFGIVKFFIHDIDRNFEHYRPGTSRPHQSKGTAHHLRNTVGEIDRIRPLGDALVVFGGNKTRGTLLAAVGPGRHHQNRNGLTISLGDTGICILDTRAGLDKTNPVAFTVGNPGVSICNIHTYSLGP